MTGWYIFPNGRMIIQWGTVRLHSTVSGWVQEGTSDWYYDQILYKPVFGGQAYGNFSYYAGVDIAGAVLCKKDSSNFNCVRLRTHVAPSSITGNSQCNINWFVIGVLS